MVRESHFSKFAYLFPLIIPCRDSHMGWVAKSEKQGDMQNIPNNQDEGVRVSTESVKDSMVKTDNNESSRNIRKPKDGNISLEEELSPAEDQDQDQDSCLEETSSESSGLVKGIIGVLYKG